MHRTAAVVLAVFASLALPQGSPVSPRPAHAAVMQTTWVKELLEFLCALYKAWGGDCAEFLNETDAIARCISIWNAYGHTLPDPYPEESPIQSHAELVAHLEALEAHLDDPGNTLGTSDDADLRGLIHEILKEAGAR